ncbi:porin [Paraburkholderia sp. UCT2]|uniref:porin n=1 Tax=Paraburkholderia sp. UCT2 TaxID=2615208 RepID=UPI00165610EB|nr:porin [Paraburkholderia sp. UCT2]
MASTHRRARITAFASLLLGGLGMNAHAQSSVTLYGILDSGILYTSKTVNPTTGSNAGHQFSFITGGQGTSVFGLTGKEDLGSGVQAIFALESGIDLSNGGFADSNGNFFGRQAWVGVAGAFGTVKAGLQYSPFVLSIIATDPRNVSTFGSGIPIHVGNVSVTGIFTSNAISYTTPTIAGFQGSVLFAPGGTPGNFQAGQQYAASLNYVIGPFMVSAAMVSCNAGGTAASTPIPSNVPFSGRTIGGSYRVGDLILKADFVNYKVSGSFDNRVYGAGASYYVTPAVNVDTGVWYTSDGNDTRNHSVMAAAGLTYNLSKATLLYTQAGFVNNRGKMDTGLSLHGALFGVQGTTVGANVGIRHRF